MIVSKMHCGIIIASLQVVCKITGDNKKLTMKIKLVFTNSRQLKSFFTVKIEFSPSREEVSRRVFFCRPWQINKRIL